MKIVWWRVLVLAGITIASGTGAWMAFSRPAPRPREPATVSAASAEPAGPLPGDLRAVLDAPPPTEEPVAVAPAPSRTGSAKRTVARAPGRTTRSGTAARPTPGARETFDDLPGAGAVSDICSNGCPGQRR